MVHIPRTQKVERFTIIIVGFNLSCLNSLILYTSVNKRVALMAMLHYHSNFITCTEGIYIICSNMCTGACEMDIENGLDTHSTTHGELVSHEHNRAMNTGIL